MTGIEWTDATWNPVVGCTIVSPGCTNCYAMKMAARIERMGSAPHYGGLTQPSKAGAVWIGKVALAPDHTLTAPLRWKAPRRVFVNSMGDLFHESVPDEWIDQAFAVMALAPQHTFQVLTKRAVWMHAYMAGADLRQRIAAAAGRLMEDGDNAADAVANMAWPLPNIWLGVSAEDQTRADERIPYLLATPAAVRFVSYEPALGPIDFLAPHYHDDVGCSHWGYLRDHSETDDFRYFSPKIDWIIAGGESGPGARSADPQWFRDVRDECAVAGVPFFMKQMGGAVKARMPAIPDDLIIREFPQ